MNLKKFGLTALFAVLGTSAFGASIDHIQNYTATMQTWLNRLL